RRRKVSRFPSTSWRSATADWSGWPRLSELHVELARVAPTQEALYADIDLALSWSERDLPERERTRHVHRLHPYLGKFIPQLVEVLLSRYFRPGQHVLDPFAGSGTTLVQALESGLDATGVDVAAFNCLLIDVKTRAYNPFVLEQELRAVHARIGETTRERPSAYIRRWFAPEAARVRARARSATVIHGDIRKEKLPGRYDGMLTSPPYPGLIDYHEQHRYAYELLRLDDRRELEVGAAAAGTSRAALADYADGIVA